MGITSTLRRLAAIAALSGITSAFGADANPAPAPTPLAMTVSGGVSLGNYQAGVTWATLLAARFDEKNRPQLTTFTGASAGNINALLGTFFWCQAESGDLRDPEQSLLFQVWTRTGLPQLLPMNEPVEAGLFSREFFIQNKKPKVDPGDPSPARDTYTHFELINGMLQNGRFDAQRCGNQPITLGLTTTRLEPTQVALKPSDVVTQTVRVAFPFQFRVNESGIGGTFEQTQLLASGDDKAEGKGQKEKEEKNKREDAIRRLGVVGVLPSDGLSDKLSLESVFGVAMASSSFPLAFQSVDLEYRTLEEAKDPASKPKHAKFADGGVFDNYPLALATELDQLAGRPVGAGKLIFVQDANRRGNKNNDSLAPPDTGAGLKDWDRGGVNELLALLSGFVPTARGYELASFGRYADPKTLESLVSTSRYHELAGDRLEAFSGFIGKPMRIYDFYAGVYDGAYSYASTYYCANQGPREKATCVFDAISNKILPQMHLGATGQMIFQRLLDDEIRPGSSPEQLKPQPSPGGEMAVLQAMQEVMLDTEEQMLGREDRAPKHDCDRQHLSKLLTAQACTSGLMQMAKELHDKPAIQQALKRYEKAEGCPADFEHTWAGLKVAPYSWREFPPKADTCLIDDGFAEFVDKPENYFDHLASDISIQLWRVEYQLRSECNDASKADKDCGTAGEIVDLLSLYVTYLQKTTSAGVVWYPSSMPQYLPGGFWGDTAYYADKYLVPESMSLETSSGTLDISYKPFLARVRAGFAIAAVVTPWQFSYQNRKELYGGGANILFPSHSLFLSGEDIKVQYLRRWDQGGSELQFEVGEKLVLGKFRFALRFNLPTGQEPHDTHRVAVVFSLCDIPGTVYWAGRSLGN